MAPRSSRRSSSGLLVAGGLLAFLRHAPGFVGSLQNTSRDQGRVALRAKATLESKLRTWIPKAEEVGLNSAELIPDLKGTFTQGLPGPLTDAEFVEVANKVAQELLGASIGPVRAAAAAAPAFAPSSAAPAAPAAVPAAGSAGGESAALEQKLRTWIPKAVEQGLDPVKLLPQLKGVFTQGLALGDADFMDVANRVLGVQASAVPVAAAAVPPAPAAPVAAGGGDAAALEERIRKWIPNAAANGLDPVKMIPELKGIFTQGLSVSDADYSQVANKLIQEL